MWCLSATTESLLVGSNSSRAITFTFRQIPLGKAWTPESSQLWVKYMVIAPSQKILISIGCCTTIKYQYFNSRIQRWYLHRSILLAGIWDTHISSSPYLHQESNDKQFGIIGSYIHHRFSRVFLLTRYNQSSYYRNILAITTLWALFWEYAVFIYDFRLGFVHSKCILLILFERLWFLNDTKNQHFTISIHC